jgi:hypothetical protein
MSGGDDQSAFLPVYDFGKGDFVGTVAGQDSVITTGLDGEPRPTDLFTLVDENGERWTVWGSAVLSRVLSRHIGHRVKISDAGTQPLENGRDLHYFDVRCATCTAQGRNISGPGMTSADAQ